MGVASSRWSAPKSGSKLGEGEVYLTNTGLLMEGAENTKIKRFSLREFPPRLSASAVNGLPLEMKPAEQGLEARLIAQGIVDRVHFDCNER